MISPSSLPYDLQDLLAKLEFLAQIGEDSKVNINTKTMVKSSSWIGSIKRMLTSEKREGTYRFITSTITETIDAINRYSNTIYLEIIIDYLRRAKIGIECLTITYENDPDMVSKLRVCITNVNLQLLTIENFDGE